MMYLDNNITTGRLISSLFPAHTMRKIGSIKYTEGADQNKHDLKIAHFAVILAVYARH